MATGSVGPHVSAGVPEYKISSFILICQLEALVLSSSCF